MCVAVLALRGFWVVEGEGGRRCNKGKAVPGLVEVWVDRCSVGRSIKRGEVLAR